MIELRFRGVKRQVFPKSTKVLCRFYIQFKFYKDLRSVSSIIVSGFASDPVNMSIIEKGNSSIKYTLKETVYTLLHLLLQLYTYFKSEKFS